MKVTLLLFGCCVAAAYSYKVAYVKRRILELFNNCSSTIESVYVEHGAVTHRPEFVLDPNTVQWRNRTDLQYAHNIAANRALFYSLIYSWTASYMDFAKQPGLQYLYMSTAANVLAGPDDVLTSGMFYLANRSYPNWLLWVSFNGTLPLFAARATREKGAKAVHIADLGFEAGTNYTNRTEYRQNEFISDAADPHGHSFYTTYTLKRHDSSGEVETKQFQARDLSARTPGKRILARTYRPAFDCGQTDEWLVVLASEASELLVRYFNWMHLRHQKPVAVSTVGVSFRDIAVNPCPFSEGNPAPNIFAHLAECYRNQECKPVVTTNPNELPYECCDTPGCSIADTRVTSPDDYTRARNEMEAAAQQCSAGSPINLDPGFWNLDDIKATFEVQGRTGLRLGHFLSNFLQNNDPAANARNEHRIQAAWEDHMNELRRQAASLPRHLQHQMDWSSYPAFDDPTWFVKADHAITRKWLEAEVAAIVLSDGRVSSAGIYLESGVFPGSSGPVSAVAWQGNDDVTVNTGDLYEMGEDFTSEAWYTAALQKFSNPATSGTVFTTSSSIRAMMTNIVTVSEVPGHVNYTATNYEDGDWLSPYLPCNNRQSDWSVSYGVPIFGKSSSGSVAFSGVVKVDSVFSVSHIYTSTA